MIAADTWHLLVRHLRYSFRMPTWVVINLIEPLIWLVLYGQLFRSLVLLPGFPTSSYLQFFSPGVVVMTALFGSAWSGMGILTDIHFGVLEKYLVTPVSRTAIIAARVLHAAVTVAIQALVILLVAVILGARVSSGVGGALLIAGIAALLGITFSAMSNGAAIILRREEPLVALLNFVLMPLLFLSTAMMPSRLMPVWVADLAHFNPVNWAVGATRILVVAGWQWGPLGRDIGLMVVFAAVLVAFAAATLHLRRD